MTNESMHAAEPNDADLVAESLAGRRDAFRMIVERYQTLVCSLAYSATGNISQSEDVAQETFISAWKDLRLLREPGKLRSWLCGIVRNRARRQWRDEGREPVRNADTLENATDSASTDALPSEQAVSREEEAILWRSLEKIPENYREPLILFYREHRSIEQVAAALELSEDAVKQRLSRGRKLLQEEVQSFVESTLRRTAPGQVFSGAVLAALPMTVGATAITGAGLGAKGTAAAKSGLLAALFWPLLGVFAGFAAQWTIFGGGPSGRQRRSTRIMMVASWIFALGFSIGGQMTLRYLGQRWAWNDRTFFIAMAWFWWLFAIVFGTWTVASYRITQAKLKSDAPNADSVLKAPAPMKSGPRMLAMLGTNLMLFSCVISLAWWAHDRAAAGIIVGIMLMLSLCHFYFSRSKTGIAAALNYTAQLASTCAVMVAILNVRFNTWAATWYGVSTTEVRNLVPTWMVPTLTFGVALWLGLLLLLTRPKSSAR